MYDIILAEVSDKEVQGFFSKVGHIAMVVVGKLLDLALHVLNGISAAVSMTPDIVLGIIFGVLFLVWAWKRLTN